MPGPAQPVVSATLGRDDARYQVHAQEGTIDASNPAQTLSAEFDQHGVEVRAGGAHWRMALAGYGYGRTLHRARDAAPQSHANRVEYRRGGLLEWYLNGPSGLEQGFTLTEPPGSKRSSLTKGEPLTIELTVAGDLEASADPSAKRRDAAGAKSLTLHNRSGQAVLRYGGLTAYDATGRELTAWVELERKEIRLRVNDTQARYPVVVDPFVQQAELTPSDGGPGNEFGYSVGMSSDGSTVVVGSQWPNNNQGANIGQGAAYVFVKPSSGWATATETAKLTASDAAAQDLLGRTISASYGADANFLGSNSNGVTQNVSDFSISATPSSQTISSGQSAPYTISLTPISGFSGSVSLGCSGGPPHSNCSVSPATVSLPGSSTASAVVRLSTPQNLNHGTFSLTFTGTFGALTRTSTVSLTVK